ncbi:MAG: hypothetical protein IH621_18430 [Krumholzibacteria bacterium]|nr:hypothetical protein [Candidatus Krumholzibacteria bacterium]
MTAHEIAEALQGLAATCDDPLTEYLAAPADDDVCVSDAVSYSEAGVLTHDAGFVLRMSNGTEFQVTIVRSR